MSQSKKQRNTAWRDEYLRQMQQERRAHPKRVRLTETALQKLRERGLLISDDPDFPQNHVGCPSGYFVALSADVGGNMMYPSPSFFGEDEAPTYMPTVTIWKKGGAWAVAVHQYAPGPGPGDFSEIQPTERAALDRIMRYFFDADDPQFLAAKAAVRD